jgi:hypothetical protein
MLRQALISRRFVIFYETPILVYFHVFNSIKLKVKMAYIHDKNVFFIKDGFVKSFTLKERRGGA